MKSESLKLQARRPMMPENVRGSARFPPLTLFCSPSSRHRQGDAICDRSLDQTDSRCTMTSSNAIFQECVRPRLKKATYIRDGLANLIVPNRIQRWPNQDLV